MSLKESVSRQLERLSSEYAPAFRDKLEASLQKMRVSLDEFNCSLASRALPEDRKGRVGRLSLEHKASAAGQRSRLKAVSGSKKTPKKRSN